MSDRDPDPDPDNDAHDWVRRVLAETGARPEPAPDWVARRVEETLGTLREEHPPGSAGAVVQMTPRRHRRWAAGLLAAAALAVGGYSLSATGVLGGTGSGGAESVTAGDAAAGDAGGGTADRKPAGVPALSSESLRADARVLAADPVTAVTGNGEELAGLPAPVPEAARDDRLQQGGDSERVQQDYSAQAESQDAASSAAGKQREPRASLDLCASPPRSVPGTRRAVTFDSQPATAVVRRLDDGRVMVQVWACESARRLAQVTVRP